MYYDDDYDYYDEDYDYLEELLEEAYLEGLYDGYYLETPRVDRGLTPDQKRVVRNKRSGIEAATAMYTKKLGNKGWVTKHEHGRIGSMYRNAQGKILH